MDEVTIREIIDRAAAELARDERRNARKAAKEKAQRERLQKKLKKVRFLIRRDFLRGLVGVPNGVKLRHAAPSGSKLAALNGLAGKLIEIRRSRTTVDFGELGHLDLRVVDLAGADSKCGPPSRKHENDTGAGCQAAGSTYIDQE